MPIATHVKALESSRELSDAEKSIALLSLADYQLFIVTPQLDDNGEWRSNSYEPLGKQWKQAILDRVNTRCERTPSLFKWTEVLGWAYDNPGQAVYGATEWA